jgi:penicillin amidase
MRILKFLVSLAITVSLIYLLNTQWIVDGNAVPPLGRFLDPYHGFWSNIESADHRADESISLPGLNGEVSIVFDSVMIPHIFADNEEDLYYAQGYVTAYHRLWQMEFQTHFAAGRISELVGEKALDLDRKQRRLGMGFGAERAIEAMMADPELNRAITAYTAGVNEYITTLSAKDLPFEYKLLDYKPEPWTPLKAGLLFMSFSQTLNISEQDLETTNALKLFGKEMVDLLYAEGNMPTGDPIIDQPGSWKFDPVKIDSIPLALPEEVINFRTAKAKPKGIGSNNWAVHGSKTASGGPILCNDPHLTLSFPSIWYVVHLNAPGVNTLGASLPGAPLVIIGFNDSIAWGVTNGQRDLVDWYKIKFKDGTRDQYLSDGKWVASKKRVEEIKIRGREPYYDTVVYTHQGPVVYDRSFHAEDEKNHYAFRWLAHDGSAELKTIYKLNRARNYDDYVDALKHWTGPAQNFAFASTRGDIAMRVTGKFPVRRQDEGRFVLDGTNSNTEWKAFIPFEHGIATKNPARGFVSSANQYPADATYPYYIQSDWYETFRNKRINEVLTSSSAITPRDMMTLQHDNLSLQARESLPLLLNLLDTASLKGDERRALEVLKYWDYVCDPESVEAPYYEAWWNYLNTLLWDEMIGTKVSLEVPDDYATIQVLKSPVEIPFVDNKSTNEKEDLKAIVTWAYHESIKSIDEWEKQHNETANWADYKDTYVVHLSRIPQLSQHVRLGGTRGIVNAADQRTGPSWRMIVSLEKDRVLGWGVYPAGQSGNPGSRFYDNLVNYWATGKYYRLHLVSVPEKLNAFRHSSLQLKPDSKK